MNPGDLREILRSIRNGKYLSEFMIATCHCHQGPIVAQQWLFEDQIPDFLPELARATIDNGADMFVGHGPHVLRGIEIYKGKPIFYGLGEFYYQWQHFDSALLSGSWPQTAGGGPGGRGGAGAAGRGSAADQTIDVRVSAGLRPINFESMVAETKYDKGQLVEIRLYPTSGAWDGPISQLGHAADSAAGDGAEDPRARAGAVEAVRHDDRDREQRRRDSRQPGPADIGTIIVN